MLFRSEAKVEQYLAHPEQAEVILERAHAFVAQFRDARRETLVSLRVLQRYFELSGQLPASRPAGPIGVTMPSTRMHETGDAPRAAG